MDAKQSLRELIDLGKETGTKILLTEGGLIPIVHAVTRENEHILVSLPELADTDRRQVRAMLSALFCGWDVVRAILAIECWTLDTKDQELLVQPSKSERREEQLYIAGIDNYNCDSAIAPIIRNDVGTIVDVGPWTEIQGSSGWFLTLLPSHQVSPEFRQKLRDATAYLLEEVDPVDLSVN